MSFRVLILFLCLALPHSAYSQQLGDEPYRKACKYIEKENYKKGIAYLMLAADMGHVAAQLDLAQHYFIGIGVDQDYCVAAEWYEKAAQQGSSQAMEELGYCYDFGFGVTKSYAEAVKWYTKANSASAKAKLAAMNKRLGVQTPSPASDPKPDFLTPFFQVTTTRDVQYATADGYWTSYTTPGSFGEIFTQKIDDLKRRTDLPLLMDIYEPKTASPFQRPLLVMIHGGGFFNGDKGELEYQRWCERFAACGYVAISVNYRMGFFAYKAAVERAAYRALQDVNAAIRYMLKSPNRYHIDPDRIFAAGCSAGAITALNLAFMNNANRPPMTKNIIFDKDLGPIENHVVKPSYERPVRIRAVCNMWGALFNLDMLRTAPTSILSFHADRDPIVPYKKGAAFGDELSKLPSMSDGLVKTVLGGFIKEATGFVVPKTYGSYLINQECKRIGKRSVLETYHQSQHTLVYDKLGRLNELHGVFFDKMLRFFKDEMK